MTLSPIFGDPNAFGISGVAPPVQVAHFEYDPFGRITASTAPPDLHFPFRFSTKLYDIIWGVSHYEYRIYSPQWHIWLARDPIGEEGFEVGFEVVVTSDWLVNTYNFVNNSAINNNDQFGLCIIGETEKVYRNIRHVAGEYTGNGSYECDRFFLDDGGPIPVLMWRCHCNCERKNFEVRADVASRICKEVDIFSFDKCENLTTSKGPAWVDSGVEYDVFLRSVRSGWTEIWNREFPVTGIIPDLPEVLYGLQCRSDCKSRQGPQ